MRQGAAAQSALSPCKYKQVYNINQIYLAPPLWIFPAGSWWDPKGCTDGRGNHLCSVGTFMPGNAKLPKKIKPNYRKKSRQITEKFRARLPKSKSFDLLCNSCEFHGCEIYEILR